ncbi:MAG: hypothetical protein WBX15_08715 [Thermoanaerobaculia bacterium]
MHRDRRFSGRGSSLFAIAALFLLLAPFCRSSAAEPPTITIDGGTLISTSSLPVVISGTASPPDALVQVTIRARTISTVVRDGRWRVEWPEPIPVGTHTVEAALVDRYHTLATATSLLKMTVTARLARKPLDAAQPKETTVRPALRPEDYQAFPDRWRITPPTDYDLLVHPRSKLDPYNQNILKGDKPIIGQEIFLDLTGISDTLVEGRKVPTGSTVSARNPGSIDFFGEGDQASFAENVLLSADLFRGQTAFRPADWRARLTLVGNFNHVSVRENAVVNPDVRRGTSRDSGYLGVQEAFFEKKIADLSPNFDFVSIRAGVQPFVSDFRGFVFDDSNLGVRLFGNARSNRYQYNLAWFDRLEKDTNSGLNVIDKLRKQQLLIANLYREDFLVPGYTVEASAHYLRDRGRIAYDSNGFLVRPDPIGDFSPHQITATYLGFAGFGRLGRINVDHALYYVFGKDSHNPIAGADPIGGGVGPDGAAAGRESVDISAEMAAVELSVDRDWYRPRIGYFYASGDHDGFDRHANGFAAIFANPNFAGGGFSFWNRLGLPLPGTGVALLHRGSFLPDLNSSKTEGQPNFVNPGLHLATAGVDVDLTTKLVLLLTTNYLRFDQTDVLQGVLFQDAIDREIGWDLSIGARYRPFLNNNVMLLIGTAAFVPGKGFEQIYDRKDTLYQLFTDLTVKF